MSAPTAHRVRVVAGPRTDAGALAALLERGYPVSRGPAHAADDELLVSVDGGAPEAVVAQVEQAREAAQRPAPGGWKPWFPVIDYDRCTHCMQCLSFCLFDVYGVDTAGQIDVQRPDNCKTDCPACSRVCPEIAILFPKYKAGPLNGADISEDDLKREAVKVDISALLGGNVYQRLRERNAKARVGRFSTERDDDQALQERQRCLAELKDSLDIPPELLASLPSPAEIARRAEQARERAEAARRAQEDSE